MKYAIVSSQDLGIDCWSAKRFTDGCESCNRILYPPYCKLPEGITGKIKYLDNKINKAREEILELEKEQNELRNRL